MSDISTGSHAEFIDEHLSFKRRIEDEFSICPKWDKHELTDAQINDIAEKAALRAVAIARENFYKDVGKAVVSKWLITIGIGTVAMYAWLRSKSVL